MTTKNEKKAANDNNARITRRDVGRRVTVVPIDAFDAEGNQIVCTHCTIQDVYHGMVVTVDPTGREITVPDERVIEFHD